MIMDVTANTKKYPGISNVRSEGGSMSHSGAECQILSFVSTSHNKLELASITTRFN